MSTIQDINCTHRIRNGLVLKSLLFLLIYCSMSLHCGKPTRNIICNSERIHFPSEMHWNLWTPNNEVEFNARRFCANYAIFCFVDQPSHKQKKQPRNSKVILRTKQDKGWLSNGNQAEFPSRQCKSKLNFEQNDMKCLTDQWLGQFLSQCGRS